MFTLVLNVKGKTGPTCTILLRWERSSASQHSSSLWRLKGSRLLRMLPVNSTGTCHGRQAAQSRKWRADSFGCAITSTLCCDSKLTPEMPYSLWRVGSLGCCARCP